MSPLFMFALLIITNIKYEYLLTLLQVSQNSTALLYY